MPAEVSTEAPQEPPIVEANKDATPSSKPVIGIIYPPPEVRNIVDKTASFVARNGPEFEARIRQNELNNPKFNFLNAGDPYHGYYQHKVKDIKEGKPVQELTSTTGPRVTHPAQLLKQQDVPRIIEIPIIPKEPPPEFEFISDPPSISAYDLDVVKLTAQFVARNGRQFLTNLMNREQRNYQFDFLRPQHSLFNYFTKLLEQYTKVLIPPKELMNKLKRESLNPKSVLDQVRYRVEWTKLQEAQRRRAEEEAERERIAYAQIDWHDFIIVETVDYQPHEQGQFPAPTTPEEVGARVLAQERFEEGGGAEAEMEVDSDNELSDAEEGRGTSDNIQVQDMEPDSDDEDARPKVTKPPARVHSAPQPPTVKPPQPPALPPNPDQVIIRKDYDPKSTKQGRNPAADQYLISPITGERIPVNKVQEHMRIGLLDPRWVEQRDRAIQEKMQQEEVYAHGSAIESSLKQLAERRTDIFGIGDEETAIGKKIGEEDKRKDEKVTWDGHTASMEAATRAARANITLEDQIHQIHKVQGLLPDEEKERIGPTKPLGSAQLPKPPGTSAPAPPTLVAKPVPPTPPPQVAAAAMHMPGPVMPVPGQGPPNMPMNPMMSQMMMMGQRHPMGHPIRPPNLMGMPPRPPVPPPMPPVHQPPYANAQVPQQRPGQPMDDEPASKKQKTEDSLMPEDEFLSKHSSPVTFKVQVPKITDKSEWKLNGQMITLTLSLTETIATVKSRLHEQIGMAPGKQKLQFEGIFFKDSNSLAFYNVMTNSVIQLQLKERGGRKK